MLSLLYHKHLWRTKEFPSSVHTFMERRELDVKSATAIAQNYFEVAEN